MSPGLAWHPRHPDRQRPSRRENVVVYADPEEPVFLNEYVDSSPTVYRDEAEVTREEAEREFAAAAVRAANAEVDLDEAVDDVFQIPAAERLPLPPRSGPRLDSAATARVGRRLQAEREELLALERAGLIDKETR